MHIRTTRPKGGDPRLVYVNEDLMMRALAARATDAERAAVEAWAASSPAHARQWRELQQMLADIAAWYRATPLRGPPSIEILMRRATLRQPPADLPPESGDE